PLCFIIGLQCGIEGAYLNRSIGAPAYSGVFSAWCDLRELVPYAFGYMMSAKVGTGLVAEIGAMRITDEIDALEVMGISSMTFLCGTRLLAAAMVLPFVYLAGVGAGFFASYLAVVPQRTDRGLSAGPQPLNSVRVSGPWCSSASAVIASTTRRNSSTKGCAGAPMRSRSRSNAAASSR